MKSVAALVLMTTAVGSSIAQTAPLPTHPRAAMPVLQIPLVDRVTPAIMAQRLPRFDHGTPTGTDPGPTIHRNFSQIIEQNFAQLSPSKMASLLDGLTARELGDLAQLYTNANADFGRPSRLLDLMAVHMDAKRLGRLSEHFGFAPIYEAVWRSAPQKSLEFQQNSNTMRLGPVPGGFNFGLHREAMVNTTPFRFNLTGYLDWGSIAAYEGPDDGLGLDGKAAWPGIAQTVDLGRFTSMTAYEVYLDFRTAPIGAMGVSGSLLSTGLVVSGFVGLGWQIGYTYVGPVVAQVIQAYAPNLWDAIGSGIYSIMGSIQSTMPGTTARGAAQASAATGLRVEAAQRDAMATTGGDWGISSEWRDYQGGQGGSCDMRNRCILDY